MNMQPDLEHKFNFFKKTEKSNNTNLIIGLGVIIAAFCMVITVYIKTPKVIYVSANTVIPKGTMIQGVLTAQNSFSGTVAPTFVIHPQDNSLEATPVRNSFERLSQKEKLTHWVDNQEPGVHLTPDEVQKIVKIMQPATK